MVRSGVGTDIKPWKIETVPKQKLHDQNYRTLHDSRASSLVSLCLHLAFSIQRPPKLRMMGVSFHLAGTVL